MCEHSRSTEHDALNLERWTGSWKLEQTKSAYKHVTSWPLMPLCLLGQERGFLFYVASVPKRQLLMTSNFVIASDHKQTFEHVSQKFDYISDTANF